MHRGVPPEGNPYLRGVDLMGHERATALYRWRDGLPVADYTFWYAPACGGARQLTDPAEVEWNDGWTLCARCAKRLDPPHRPAYLCRHCASHYGQESR